MPIYEFACPKCRVIFNFLSKRVNPDRLHSDALPLVRPLALTAEQSSDLVTFLRTLSVDVPLRPSPLPLCP